jgi:hypothetical protein
MNIYLFKDCFRLEGISGNCVETEFSESFVKYDKKITLPTARRQFVSFQIGVEGAGAKDVQVAFSDLKDGKGNAVAKENFECYVQWCHKIEGRLIPDMLIPQGAVPFAIPLNPEYHKDQTAGAFWIDLFVPEGTAAGDYTGTITAGGQDFGLELEVFDIVTPAESKIVADMNNYADCVSRYSKKLAANPERYRDGSLFAYERKLAFMSREHRTLFHQLPYMHSGHIYEGYAPILEGEGKDMRVQCWDLFDEHYGPYLDGSAFKGSRVSERPIEYLYSPFHLLWPASYEKFGQKGYRTEYRRILAEFVRHFEDKGWTETLYEIILNNKKDYRFVPYTSDEIWYEHDEESIDIYWDVIKDVYNSTKAQFKFRIDDSNHYGNHYDHRFSDYCDIFVAGQAMFSWYPESVPVMKNKGNKIIVYGGILKQIQEPMLGTGAWPFYCFMTQCDGFCAWNATAFGDYLNTPLQNGAQAVYYPGEAFGLDEPMPSLRLKYLRNAMQLNDIAMTVNGTRFAPRFHPIINKHFGKAHMDDWWQEKPPFIDTPPRYWDWGKDFANHCMKPLEEGLTPLTLENLTLDLYPAILSIQGKPFQKGAFQYY